MHLQIKKGTRKYTARKMTARGQKINGKIILQHNAYAMDIIDRI